MSITTTMRSLVILTYHSLDDSDSVVSVAPGVFETQMASLADGDIRAISLREALDFRKSRNDWPENVLVLTFDDGFANVYEQALPVLVRHGFGATVFLIAGHAGGTNDWDSPPPGLGVRPMISWREAERLMESDVEIGAHGLHHVDLSRMGGDAVETEIADGVERIRSNLGQAPQTFAYPYGFVTPHVAGIAARHFRACCTTVHRRASVEPLSLLPRIEMYYFRNCRDLRPLAFGRLDRVIALRRWMRAARRWFMRPACGALTRTNPHVESGVCARTNP